MTVKVVKPIKITEAVLTASSIPEPDASVGEVEWVERQYVFDISADNVFGACTDGAAYYIVDFAAFAVKKYNLDFVYTGFSIDVSGQTISPGGICFANGLLHVIDSGSGTVFKYNPDGSYTGSSFSTAQFGTFIDFDGEYFHVSIRDSYLIKVFDGTGVLSTEWDASSVTSGPIRGISIRGGDVYVSYIRRVIRRYSISGVFSGFELEVDEDDFQSPPGCVDLIVDSKINQILVQSQDYKVAVYELDGTKDNKYQPGERAILTSTHKLYQCVKATNIRPDLGATGDETETWVEVGATNKFSSFDDRLSYQAQITGTQSFELTLADRVNTVAFLNLTGITSVRVQMEVGGSIVYDTTKDGLDTSPIYDHYTWWFGDIELVSELIFDDLPPYPTTKLIIDVTGEGDLGQIVTGFAKEIGVCLAESSSNTIDLSTQEFDAFGNRKYVPKPIIKLNKYEILSDKSIAPAVERLFRDISGGNALWIGEIGGDQLLTTYGYTERSPIPYNMPTAINYSATIRGSA